MKLLWKLSLILLVVIVVGAFFLLALSSSCTEFSQRVCNSEEKCCYRESVPISCSGIRKDIAYYQEKGLTAFGDIPREEALKLLNQEEGTEWTYCTEDLP